MRRDSAGEFRIFTVTAGASARLSGLAIGNGALAGPGAGIFNAGTLTVDRCIVQGNHVLENYSDEPDYTYAGGGIFNSGELALIESTVRANSARGSGGGIFNAGTLSVSRSTVTENQTLRVPGDSLFAGGGIFNFGTLTLDDSILSANSADGDGGGLFNYHTAVVAGSRIIENLAFGGGGFSNSAEEQIEAPPPPVDITLSGAWTLDINGDGDLDAGIDLQFSRLNTNGDGLFNLADGDLRFRRLRGLTRGVPVVGRFGLGPE